ncbi:hypothetical protein KMW28_18815 [Flammeovirga yaeyamensis]|uniref:Prokaryotic RING finger family 4 n=1 Tax=Flammeovirga yaeyamensis TaxID=367791 RepID=A0AAX1N7A3_9BACT|nr:hypothetical protein [Flammeovirga yaeyamensis]MBB3701207.1 hypothetical protein [Flammeovirga yaeyamensis]NMF38467.1 hypothetical protein [Flammeovirga yaeyamensis]QWG01673.1 hypothetical protein KMW28_18815 [Flammeovirga yaeyamensis]
MNRDLQKVAIRNNAIVLSNSKLPSSDSPSIKDDTLFFLKTLQNIGYTFSKALFDALNEAPSEELGRVYSVFKKIHRLHSNWTPLIRKWNIPEEIKDRNKTLLLVWLSNLLGEKKGTQLTCGHRIPDGTFKLEKYNGCPICGTPFQFEKLILEQSDAIGFRKLELWTEEDLEKHFLGLLQSKNPLDATQVESLKTLLFHFGLPKKLKFITKENKALVIDYLITNEEHDKLKELLQSPKDILRYLWYKKTGYLQIIKPKTIIVRNFENTQVWHIRTTINKKLVQVQKEKIKLHFSRSECRKYAQWINELPMSIEKQCEEMHPNRNMWVRVIRALRLTEWSNHRDFGQLAQLLDAFYNSNYEVWRGQLNHFLKYKKRPEAFELLKANPGYFSRSLFSLIFRFGVDDTLKHFEEISSKVPMRLIMTLSMYAEYYFSPTGDRLVKPLGGKHLHIMKNKNIHQLTKVEREEIVQKIKSFTLEIIKKHLSQQEVGTARSIYIDPQLYNVPISIGDRSQTIQDNNYMPSGVKLPLKGDTIRLFMQWGEGLPAQHLDMDLSCAVVYSNKQEYCNYGNMVIDGCKHSGDIIYIPDQIGTAEYIEIDIPTLQQLKAKYVYFTCNSYSSGNLSPNLMVGWMDAKHPMKVTKSGVAYHPAHVQQQVKINDNNLTKGLLFGVLDVEKKEVLWLELEFGGQVVHNMSLYAVKALIKRLDSKIKIGELLELKAEVHQQEIANEKENADQIYDQHWALNLAEVNQLWN